MIAALSSVILRHGEGVSNGGGGREPKQGMERRLLPSRRRKLRSRPVSRAGPLYPQVLNASAAKHSEGSIGLEPADVSALS